MTWWERFTHSFEEKGAQILLLWVTDLLFVALLLLFARHLEAAVLATITGLVGGVNGAFLGAMGAKPGNGNPPPPAKPDTLVASLTPEK